MRILSAAAFALSIAVSFAACAGQEEGAPDEPLVINDELLKDTFEECEIDIGSCLSDTTVIEEIGRRVEAGEWAWPASDSDELDAARAVFYTVWTGCVSEKWKYAAAASRCYGHWRRGRLYNVTGVRERCSTSIYNHKARCVRSY